MFTLSRLPLPRRESLPPKSASPPSRRIVIVHFEIHSIRSRNCILLCCVAHGSLFLPSSCRASYRINHVSVSHESRSQVLPTLQIQWQAERIRPSCITLLAFKLLPTSRRLPKRWRRSLLRLETAVSTAGDGLKTATEGLMLSVLAKQQMTLTNQPHKWVDDCKGGPCFDANVRFVSMLNNQANFSAGRTPPSCSTVCFPS